LHGWEEVPDGGEAGAGFAANFFAGAVVGRGVVQNCGLEPAAAVSAKPERSTTTVADREIDVFMRRVG
jgi:hypothetical protein